MTPFEQLERIDLISEPRQAFEDIVAMLLKECDLIDGRIRVFRGDGGIDFYRGSFAEGALLTVYQSKYFTRAWTEVQKRQIRNSFETVSDQFQLEKWFLCIPVRPTVPDLRWFDNWGRGKPIDLMDGDTLTEKLRDPRASGTRQRLTEWGVLSVPGGSHVLQVHLRCIRLGAAPGTPLYRLSINLKNAGDRTAEDVQIKLTHSATRWIPGHHNETFWNKLSNPMFDVPSSLSTLKAKEPLHPGAIVEILQIPLGTVGGSAFPFRISLEYWSKNQPPGRQALVISDPPAERETMLHFRPGEIVTQAAPDEGFVPIDLPYPTNGILRNILDQIAAHPNPGEFGFVDFGQDPAGSDMALYRPHLSQVGAISRMSRESLTWAMAELIRSGWLEPLEPIGNTLRYALSDAGKHSESLIRQVNWYKSQRAR